MASAIVNTLDKDSITPSNKDHHINLKQRELVEKQLLVVFLQLARSRQKRLRNQRKNHRSIISASFPSEEYMCQVIITNTMVCILP